MTSETYRNHGVSQVGSEDVAKAAVAQAEEKRREYLAQKWDEIEARERGRTVPEWVMLWEGMRPASKLTVV